MIIAHQLARRNCPMVELLLINCQDTDTRLSLIDGQQRTTTFLLLLKALLVRINTALSAGSYDEDSAGLIRGLQERRRRIMGILYKAETEDIPDKPNREKDTTICRRALILDNRSINEKYKSELKTILQAIDYEGAEANAVKIKYKQKENRYTNYFRNYKFYYEKVGELSESQLNTVAKTITDNCEVIEIKSWDVEQAIKMFNSLNSDGLPLFDSDIISAQLYAEAEKKGNEKEFSNLWKQLNDSISELNPACSIDINSILMQYMYYIRAKNRETVTSSGSVNVTTPGLRRYFIDENREPIHNPLNTCEDMLRLTTIWQGVSESTLAKLLFKFNDNSKLFMASYFLRSSIFNVNEFELSTILECMLRLFSILELMDSGFSSKYFKTFLFGEQIKFIDPVVSSEEIKKDFDSHIRENWSQSQIYDALMDYEGNLLVYLNEYLFAKESRRTLVWGSKYDIEHIMPNSGINLSEIRMDAGIGSVEEFEEVVNRLGNKIVLEEKINRAIGNEWFRTKVSTNLANKTGYINSNYPIACALVDEYRLEDKPYWTKDDILKTTEVVSRRIERFIFGI